MIKYFSAKGKPDKKKVYYLFLIFSLCCQTSLYTSPCFQESLSLIVLCWPMCKYPYQICSCIYQCICNPLQQKMFASSNKITTWFAIRNIVLITCYKMVYYHFLIPTENFWHLIKCNVYHISIKLILSCRTIKVKLAIKKKKMNWTKELVDLYFLYNFLYFNHRMFSLNETEKTR